MEIGPRDEAGQAGRGWWVTAGRPRPRAAPLVAVALLVTVLGGGHAGADAAAATTDAPAVVAPAGATARTPAWATALASGGEPARVPVASPTTPITPVAPDPPDPPPSDPPPSDPPPIDPPDPPPGAGVVAPGARYAWPLLPPPAVLTPFDRPAHPFGPGHRGVDLAGSPGRPVLAAQQGTVVYAGPLAGRAVVSVQHPDGLRTTYEPVRPTVVAGAVVDRGTVIGTLEPGHPGCSRTCLHWGVRRDRLDYLDPLVLLRAPHVRLLPVPDPWPP